MLKLKIMRFVLPGNLAGRKLHLNMACKAVPPRTGFSECGSRDPLTAATACCFLLTPSHLDS